MIEPETVPFIAGMTHLKRFDECKEVLTSRHFRTGRFEDHSTPLIDNAFLFSDGKSHKLRRAELNKLTTSARLAAYDQILEPIVRQALAEVSEQAGDDGLVRLDLMLFVRMILIRVASAIVGLDDLEDIARGHTLLDYIERFSQGVTVKWSTRDPAEVVAEALEVKAIFDAEYFAPSLARRRALVAEYVAGKIPRESLPTDFITLSLLPECAFQWDDDLRLKDAIILLNGGLGTSAGAMAAALGEYWEWDGRQPQREGDLEYIRQVLNETLRLHPPVPFLPRQASEGVVLKSGRAIAKDEMVVVLPEFANRDLRVFGDDAMSFRPERAADLPEGVNPFGLAFGGGSHLCFGMPIATQAAPAPAGTAMHRPMLLLLRELIRAGVRPDTSQEAPMAPSARPSLLTYPVIVPAPARSTG